MKVCGIFLNKMTYLMFDIFIFIISNPGYILVQKNSDAGIMAEQSDSV